MSHAVTAYSAAVRRTLRRLSSDQSLTVDTWIQDKTPPYCGTFQAASPAGT